MADYSFRWTCSYGDEVNYQVYGDGQPYEATVRWEASDYFRSIWNGDEASWQAQCVAAIGLIRGRTCEPMSQDVVDAFNAWRAHEHARGIAELKANPGKYGVIDENDDLHKPPPVVRGAYWGDGKWIITSP